ncbi:uncharacterized protein DS421_13g427530 [Arachis hypogaea]|nr:uncharacterized protein DS421_13g427530 [Arachis hypogaea]
MRRGRGKREGTPVEGRTVHACFCRRGVRRREEEHHARRAAREGEREGSEVELVRACSVAGPRVMGGRGERGIRGWSASPVLGRSVAAIGDGWPSAGGFVSVFLLLLLLHLLLLLLHLLLQLRLLHQHLLLLLHLLLFEFLFLIL